MSIDELEKSMDVSECIPGPGPIIDTGPSKPIQSVYKDPWKHRSKYMKCTTCMWFVRKEATTPTMVGRCRRHAPTMNGYPVVYDTDWCGDHKVDESKV